MRKSGWLLLLLQLVMGMSYAQSFESWMEQGKKLKLDKKASEALKAFQEASKLKPNDPEAMYEAAWCCNDLGKYADAIQLLRKVRPVWNRTPKVFFELGYAFQKQGMNDSAKQAFADCLALKPDHINAYKQLAYLAYDNNKNEEAISYFNQAISNSKTEIQDYLFWCRKGFCENALKRYNDAISSLHQSERFKKDYGNTYLELGYAFTRLKYDDSAIASFNKAIELNPKDHVGYNGIAEVYRDNKKDRNTAMTWYQKVLAMNATERKANYGMGYCLNSLQRYSEALPYLQQAIRSEATYTSAFVELGYAQYKLGNSQDALQHFSKALTLNPENVNARYYSCLVYIDQKDKTKAQQMVNELRGRNDKYAAELQREVDQM